MTAARTKAVALLSAERVEALEKAGLRIVLADEVPAEVLRITAEELELVLRGVDPTTNAALTVVAVIGTLKRTADRLEAGNG